MSLARAREKLIDARRSILEGRSPAQEKQREKRRIKEAKSFGEFGERWLKEARMADSTRAIRRSIFERDSRWTTQKGAARPHGSLQISPPISRLDTTMSNLLDLHSQT